MKNIIALSFIVSFLLASSCTNKQPERSAVFDYTHDSLKVKTDSVPVELRDSLLSRILDIPEVKKYSEYLEKETSGKQGATAFIDPANNTEQRYTVNVGLSSEGRFDTVYIFYVDKRSGDISVLHQPSGQDYPLSEWQKRYERYMNGEKDAFSSE
ncbi:hypothetical protein [Dysgonomonas termitidis]|uniref:Lipoprotein n=1 Tax=Dysgonomonas termitidis TaxID=1516126 RepID=A0ABV9L2T1_9BACT